MGVVTGGMEMSEQPQPPAFEPGQVVNGHVWTGTEWLRLAEPAAAKPKSAWLTVAGVVCMIVALLAGLQGLSWLIGFYNLESDGNQFAGLLALLGMGAAVVAVAFGVAGVVLMKK